LSNVRYFSPVATNAMKDLTMLHHYCCNVKSRVIYWYWYWQTDHQVQKMTGQYAVDSGLLTIDKELPKTHQQPKVAIGI